ncbi:MAG: hypothetical protein GY796_24895, partial [Chloroflexi bacterium]|nr:hypothetical protein [Chloroflexota bacterium]
MKLQVSQTGRQRLQFLTFILIVLAVAAILVTLVQWWLVERSLEPLNVLFFAALSLLTAFLAWLSRADNVALPESIAVAEDETVSLAPLRRQIADSFTLDELRALCLVL